MGEAFYDELPDVREQFDRLDRALDVDLTDLCFAGSRERLRTTANTQPAVFATGLAAYTGVVERLGEPEYVAGHSLGHLTALAAAGAFDPTDGIRLVRRRGEAMQQAANADGPGTMVAVLLADADVVRETCETVDDAAVAGFNAPRQTVVSGTEAAVDRVQSIISDQTRARFVELDVGAGFHSPVMRSAVEPFTDALDDTPVRPADVPVCSDVTGDVYTDPGTARRDLADQVTSPIDWVGVVEALDERGVDHYVELPPAGTLVDLVEKIAPDAETTALEDPATLREISGRAGTSQQNPTGD